VHIEIRVGGCNAVDGPKDKQNVELFFSGAPKTIDAVIRNFTIIGEAARHIPDEIVQSHPEIPLREMADLRNIIVHEYFGVSEKIIWETIQTDLPGLLSSLRIIV
jgi:uncharacterized protein with HEPN domain